MAMLRVALFITLTGSFAGLISAQESRGAIGGRVTDPQGHGIPKVKVAITNADSGVTLTTSTNDQGAYSAPLLLPGSYRIAASQTGFKSFRRDGIELRVNDILQIDIAFEIGSVSETMSVTASAPILDTTGGNLGLVVTTKELTELPIAHGNPYALISLAAGTTFEGDPLLNRPYEPTHIVSYSMGGSVAGTTDITLDGVSNTSRGGAGAVAAGYVPPVDAIGEVRIETSSFDARAGQTSGGMVNISLRSGGNKLHGNATFTKMRPQWMANSWFGNRVGAPRGVFGYNRWSGSLSGPIVVPKIYDGHNKTFFMWAYEQLADSRPRGAATLTVPTAPQRKGDFSQLLALGANYQIYDPSTRRRDTEVLTSTRYRQDPFPGNVIPAARFDPVALKILEYFPLPLNGGTTADFRNNFPRPNSPEIADYFTHTVRVDHNVSASNRLFVRGNGYIRDTRRNDYFETRATGLRERFTPVGASFDDVHTLSPSFVLNLRYGYTRFVRQTTPLYGRGFDLGSLGFPASFTNQISPAFSEFPAIEINGYFNTVRTGEARFMDTHSLVAALTKLRGNHTVDFGFETRAYRQNSYTGDSSRSGRFIFDPTWTRGPLDNSAVSPIGQGMAAFLLGLPNANSLVSRPADFAEQSTVWAGYVQDSWRVRKNLTVNLGLRYELEGPLTERYNKSIRDFDADATLPIEAAARAAYAASYEANPTLEMRPDQFRVRGGLVFAGVGGQSRELWSRDANNFAPRVSIAYTPFQQTVVRAGYGIFFGALGLRRTDVTQNGFARTTPFVPTRDSGLTFSSTLSNPFPNGILEPVGADQGVMTDVGNSVTFFNPAPRANYNQRWQFSIQRQLGASNRIEVAYVGNRTTKMEVSRDLNVVGNQLLSRSPFFDVQRVGYLTANIANPFRNLPGVNGTLGTNNTIARENLLKPFPQFSAVTSTTYQGYSWYHSLQVSAQRRIARGLTFNGSFTWSRNMLALGFLNPGDDLPYETLSGADRPLRVTSSVLYELPVGRGRNSRLLRNIPRWLDSGIGGWQISTIYIFQSGQPLAWQDVIFVGQDPAAIGQGQKTVDRWFNVDAGFTRNTATRPSYHYRTWPLYFSNLRRDAMNNVDLSLNKRWRLGERSRELQLRGEALNGFNHPQFGAPQMDQFNSGFGQITATANYARQVQVVVRLGF
jgi:hypothetical protein